MKVKQSLLLLSVPLLTRAATITLFAVQATTGLPTPIETFKAIGVGEDGATTYANEMVFSEFLVPQLSGWTTYTSGGKTVTAPPPFFTATGAPITDKATLIADASHYVYSVVGNPELKLDNNSDVTNCSLDGKGAGSCVKVVRFADGVTITTSYTGAAVPIYTLITTDDQGDSAKDNGVRSDTLHIGWGVIGMGIIFGAYLGL